MNRLIPLVGAALLLGVFTAPSLAGETGWQCELQLRGGVAENRLVFGQQPGASDGFDGRYDVPAMLSGSLRAHFAGSAGKKLWRDTRAPDAAAPSWELRVTATRETDAVVLSWKSESLPAEKTVVLHDLSTGTMVDMHAVQSYLIENDGLRALRILVQE